MYTVVYNSLTGNTKLLADTIKSVLPNNNNDDIVFVGFWTDKGNADSKTIEYLKLLRNKRYSYLAPVVLVAVLLILKEY